MSRSSASRLEPCNQMSSAVSPPHCTVASPGPYSSARRDEAPGQRAARISVSATLSLSRV
jgi:hypothetical protein